MPADMNVTSMGMTGLASMNSFGALGIVVVIGLFVGLMSALALSPRFMRWLNTVLGVLRNTFGLFVEGTIATILLSGLGWVGVSAGENPGTTVGVLSWVGIVLGAYVVLSCVGWVSRKVRTAIKKNYARATVVRRGG